MIRLSRCDAGPVIWIGTTFGSGRGCGGVGPCALALAASAHSNSAATAKVLTLRLIRMTVPPSCSQRRLTLNRWSGPVHRTTDGNEDSPVRQPSPGIVESLPPLRAVIADDELLLREGVARVLDDAGI